VYITLLGQMMNVHSRERFTFTYCSSSVALFNKLKSIATWFEFFVYAIWEKEKCIILIDISYVSVGRWKLVRLFGFCTMHEDIWSTRDEHATEWKKRSK
jgi:hypothetical protein